MKKRLVLWGVVVVVAVVIGIGVLPLHTKKIHLNEADQTSLVPVFGTTTVSQTFKAPGHIIKAIDLQIGSTDAISAGETLTFALTEESGKTLRTQEVKLQNVLKNENSIHVEFKPLITKKEQQYRFTIGFPHAQKINALLVPFQIAGELYPDGQYFIKDKTRPGDLGFSIETLQPLAVTWPQYFTINSPIWSAVLVILIGIVIRKILMSTVSSETPAHTSKKFRIIVIALAVISLLFFTYAVHIGTRGAFYDTAHDGLEAMEEVLMGNIQPFYEHYTGHQPLMDWILAVEFLFIGINTWTLHSVGIVSGVVSVIIIALVAKNLWGERAGVYAGLFALTSHWLLIISEEGTRIALVTPVVLVWCWAITNLRNPKNKYSALIWSLAAGIALGLLGYIYAAGWLLIPPLGIFTVGWLVWSWKKEERVRMWSLMCTCLVSVLILFPLLRYFINEPERIFEHPKEVTGAATPVQMIGHTISNIPSTISGLTWLPVGSTESWVDNGYINVGPIPIPFPIPLLSPLAGIAIIPITLWIIWKVFRRQLKAETYILFFAVLALLPALISNGSQPAPRRSIGALVPLLLLLAWGSEHAHQYVASWKSYWAYIGGGIVIFLTLAYGPVLYVGFVPSSEWFQTYYLTDLDLFAPSVIAHSKAGHNLAVIGNWAHLKSFQYYALATPRGKEAFTLLNTNPARWPTLTSFDVIAVAAADCENSSFPGFNPKPQTVVRGHKEVIGCIFTRPGIPAPQENLSLPSSGPLWNEWRSGQGRFREHRPFKGPIFGRL